LVLIIALVVIATPVSATTWTIHPGTGVINATINNGSVLSGDTIILSPGTYFENNINVSTNINILSSGSQANTFIDGNQSEGGLFIVTGSYALSITGVTMKNANASTLAGGAIDSLISGTVTVSSSTITNCSAINGGAIVAQGNIVLTSSTITNCSAKSVGGALATMGNVAITSSTITNCVASGGGAIASVGGGTVTVTSSTINNCSAGATGGAIVALEGNIMLISSTISDCTALNTGGAITSQVGTVTMTSSTISNCLADDGGGIADEGGNVIIEGSSVITFCEANEGAAIETEEGNVTIEGSSIISNCTAFGGAIITEGGTDTITSSTISNCTAQLMGGAIMTEGNLSMSSSTITGCTALLFGGGIVIAGNATISSSTITGCSAGTFGGAILYSGVGLGEAPSILTTTLSHVASVTSAAGTIGSGPFSITRYSVSPSGAGSLGPTTFSMTGTTISGCSAGYGGALFTIGGNTVITSSTITGCTVLETGGGGAINTTDPVSGTMQFSQIYNNSIPEVTNGAILPVAPGDGIPSLTATDNFWGTNSPSSSVVNGSVTYNPWLVLGISATPTSFVAGGSSTVQANLIYDSNGDNTYSPGNAVADGTPVSFAVISGKGSLNPSQGSTTSGVSQTAFTSFTSGTSVVQATVDGFPVSVPITVTGKARSTGTCYWCSGNGASGSGAGYTGSSASSSGYTGPSPTQSGGSPTQMPTVKPAVVTPTIVTPAATAPVTTVATMASLPTNTPKTGLDMVPTLGALGLCGAIFLFRKNRD